MNCNGYYHPSRAQFYSISNLFPNPQRVPVVKVPYLFMSIINDTSSRYYIFSVFKQEGRLHSVGEQALPGKAAKVQMGMEGVVIIGSIGTPSGENLIPNLCLYTLENPNPYSIINLSSILQTDNILCLGNPTFSEYIQAVNGLLSLYNFYE